MRSMSGLRTLLVIALLFTSLAVHGSTLCEDVLLFNSIQTETKINVQVGSDSSLFVGEVLAIDVVGLKPELLGMIPELFGMLIVVETLAYIGFEMGNNILNNIDGSRAGHLFITGFT